MNPGQPNDRMFGDGPSTKSGAKDVHRENEAGGHSGARPWLVYGFGAAVTVLPALATFWYLQFGLDPSATLVEIPEPTVLGLSETTEFARPIPKTVTDVDEAKAALGERLFHEPRLSKDDSLSCASCHKFEHGGADSARYSTGVSDEPITINTPTVLNAGFNFRQFWDGRAHGLREQAEGPIVNPLEMGANWVDVIAKLSKDRPLWETFDQIYGDGITRQNIVDAIAAYERTLITPDSRFDLYLAGHEEALSPAERRGLDLFESLGCPACHQGINLGGNMFQRLGVVNDFYADQDAPNEADNGRYNVTGDEEDRYVFKVPSLRNVALTAPYFHDGSVPTLESAAEIMAWYQLGVRISDDEAAALAAFMGALTGTLPEHPS